MANMDRATKERLAAIPTALEWTNQRPTREGLYLRNNPVVSHIVRQYIYEIDGVLRTGSGDGAPMNLDEMHHSFLWFGPIPKLPSRADEEGG